MIWPSLREWGLLNAVRTIRSYWRPARRKGSRIAARSERTYAAPRRGLSNSFDDCQFAGSWGQWPADRGDHRRPTAPKNGKEVDAQS